jgi:pSer/pThr/pTyr-binding forkhead associated (FHA) protein/DNA-binding CsgD family transcriptional regulator
MPDLLQPLPRPATGGELRAIVEAERRGSPFIVLRDNSARLRIFCLTNRKSNRTIGRGGSNDISLPWDGEVSRVHAEIERIGDCWALADDGLSTNGTFVNGNRITARCRLADGDSVRVGVSVLVFREPRNPLAPDTSPDTVPGGLPTRPERLSPTQRRVLIALCRPFKNGNGFAAPATNQQVAAELYLSVDRVKTHLRILFEKFGLAELPQNRKRLELVQRALLSGLITPRDL